jgi:hypothetical protein
VVVKIGFLAEPCSDTGEPPGAWAQIFHDEMEDPNRDGFYTTGHANPALALAEIAKTAIKRCSSEESSRLLVGDREPTSPATEIETMNAAKLNILTTTLQAAMVEAIKADPGMYNIGVEGVPARVALTMEKILEKGLVAVAIDGPSWKAAAKKLGVKPTKKAWTAFLEAA